MSEKIKNTCNPKCKFWKKYKENCPLYIETTWTAEGSNSTHLIRDCSPKRAVLLNMDLLNRLFGIQKAVEQGRNYQHNVLTILTSAINNSNMIAEQMPVNKQAIDAEILKIEEHED